MPTSIFLAGASGVIGRRLMPLLVAAGHRVVGTTRSPERAEALRAVGVRPTVVDAYDAARLVDVAKHAAPDVVIHQLTDLSLLHVPGRGEEARARNARLRVVATRNLVAAALMAGARRLIAQSIAFAYAPGVPPLAESAPLNLQTEGGRAVAALEHEVTATPGLDGIVLRYGLFYGPGTGTDEIAARGSVHVDAAAHAALLAVERGRPGIYNVADDDGAVSIDKACAQLGFDPGFRLHATH